MQYNCISILSSVKDDRPALADHVEMAEKNFLVDVVMNLSHIPHPLQPFFFNIVRQSHLPAPDYITLLFPQKVITIIYPE